MKRTYEQEKSYCERRAQALSAEMGAAIETIDKVRFIDAYAKSTRYMKRKQRRDLMRRFLERSIK